MLITSPVPHEEAARQISDRPAVTRAVFDRLLPEFQQRCFTVTGIECLAALRRVRELTAELPLGADWDEQKEKILSEISPWLITATDPEGRAKQTADAVRRAELVLRNNGWAGYAVTQHNMIMEQADVFPSCQYLSSEDSRVRATHAALNKKIFPTNHPFWATHTPPWEHGCRCDKVPMMQEDVDEIRDEQKSRPLEDRDVVEGAALTEVENGRLVLPNGTGFLDIRTPREKTGKGYEFRPDSAMLTYDQVMERYSPAEAVVFQKWAEVIEIQPGVSLSESLGGPKPAAAPAIDKTITTAPVRISPVSAALDVKISNRVTRAIVQDALNAIDQVHDDGQLPPIPVTGKTGPHSAGEYGFKTSTGEAIRISINSTASHPLITTAHEVGHFLDHQALGTPGRFASQDGSHPIGQIVAKLSQTPSYQQMVRESGNVRYYADPREVWARAYAQYIATASQHPAMLAELEEMLADKWTPWQQWQPAEFEPIMQDIKSHFESIQWKPTHQ